MNPDSPAAAPDLVLPRSIHQHIDALNAQARALRESDAKHGLQLAQTAYSLAVAERYREGVIASLTNQSHCSSWLSDFVTALAQGLEALRLAEASAPSPSLPDSCLALARAHLHLSNVSESVEFAQRALQSAREQGDRLTEADALNVLGINYYRTDNYDSAFCTYAEALALHRALNNPQGECKVLVNIAQAHSTRQDYEQALTVAYAGLKLAREARSQMLEAYMLHTLGQIYGDKGLFDTALDYLAQALPAADAVGNQYVRLVSMVAIGELSVRSRQSAAAIAHLKETLALAEQLGSKLYCYRCHEALAAAYEQCDAWRQALAHYKQFHMLKESVFNESSAHRLHSLEIVHQMDTARREAEIYHLRNVALEQEIAERRRLEAELLHQATTDVLTNVANRRHFLALARIALTEAIQQHQPLALALIDLDHFKRINDTHGHAVGDQVLRTLAATCMANVRPGDHFARFGGDEFVVLLPGVDHTGAQRVLERIRQALAAERADAAGAPIAFSISVGVTTLQHTDDTLDALLARADQALYQAKHAGRNQVAVAVG